MQSKNNPVYAVIDVGTNTCLLLIAGLEGKKLNKIFEAQEIPRLGKDLYKTGIISNETFQRVLSIIKNYVFLSQKYNSQKILAFGTSALRDAKNSKEFIDFIFKETGIRINVLTGEEEARYSYEGAIFDLDNSKQYAVIDIGGGSTEISFMNNKKFNFRSFNFGAVRLMENFFSDNFTESNINKAKEFIRKKINHINFDINDRIFVGVAGTITTLSAIKLGLTVFEEEKIHKDKLLIDDVRRILVVLINMTESQRLSLGSFMQGRSDIIICGALILLEFMDYFKQNEIIVSTKGLRYGLMLNTDDFI